MMTIASKDELLTLFFEQGFRDLFVRDLRQADSCDVRMGTFTLCASFIDALSLTYSAGVKVKRGDAGKWARFMERFFGQRYRELWDSYKGFRCLLLHNYAPSHELGFTHGPETVGLHLKWHDGRLMLHRESFVASVIQAFEEFCDEVKSDPALQTRALKWLALYPPVGLVPLQLPAPESTFRPTTEGVQGASASGPPTTTTIRP